MSGSVTEGLMPSCERPPLVETVLGVQFEPIEELSAGRLGAFWKRMGPDWPHTRDAPPLQTVRESFDDVPPWILANLQLVEGPPSIRLQIETEWRDRMVQVQSSRLILNWKKTQGNDYARYENIRPLFFRVWEQFKLFLKEEGLQQPRLNQWEVVYVNRIDRGTVWVDDDDVPGIFKMPISSLSQTKHESVHFRWRFELPPKRGRLHVDAQQREDYVHFSLVSRGELSDESEISDCFDFGRDTVVRSFFELTSDEAQACWGKVE